MNRVKIKGKVLAVCTSEKTGEQKKTIEAGEVVENYGIKKDAHAGDWHRQVSLLANESIEKMKQQGLDISYGDFAENIITEGISLTDIPIGHTLMIGNQVRLKVTQIGKACHDRCAIYEAAGDCVMPREGIFTRVEKGGVIRPGDEILVEA